MSREVVCARADLTDDAVVELMCLRKIGCLPVVDGRGAPVGMITKRDVLEQILEARRPGAITPALTAGRLMMPLALTLREHATLAHVVAMMALEQIHHVPIVSEARAGSWSTRRSISWRRRAARCRSFGTGYRPVAATASRRASTALGQRGQLHRVRPTIGPLAWRLLSSDLVDPQAARRSLLAQHDQIRIHLGTCGALARCLRGGDPLYRELNHAFVELRTAIEEHNHDEAELIRRLLAGPSSRGEALIDRMLVEHQAEHAAIGQLLIGSLDEVAAQMDELVETVEAHMAAEERTFLSPQVLRHPP